MTLEEFAKHYYLHGSEIEAMTYDTEAMSLTFRIGFCQWAQAWYKPDMPKLTTLTVSFLGAGVIGYPDHVDLAWASFVSCNMNGSAITFCVQTGRSDYAAFTVRASSVEVAEE